MAVEPIGASVLDLVDKLEKERLEKIARAWEAYGGDHPDALAVGADDVDDNIEENLCRLVVKKGVSHLVGRKVEFEIAGSERKNDGSPKNDEAIAEDILEEILRVNRRPRLLRNFATNGGVTGHAFGKVLPAEKEFDPDDRKTFPKIRAVDPGYVLPSWEEDDYEEIYRYRISYAGIDRDDRPVLIRQEFEKAERRGGDIGWEIRNLKAEVREGDVLADYAPTRARYQFETQGAPVWWPFEDAPIFENQNLPRPNEYWGEADLEPDVIDVNYALNALLSYMNRIARIYAHPRTYVAGVSAAELAEIDVSPDGMINIPNPEGSIGVVRPEADLKALLDLYLRLRSSFHEQTFTPEVSSGRLEGIGNLSGVALEILFGPSLERTSEKRETYGESIEHLLRSLLRLARNSIGKVDPDDALIVVKWPDFLPNDREGERRILTFDRDLGVSTKTVLEKLGYDPDSEAQQRREEAEEAEAAFNANRPPVPPVPGNGLPVPTPTGAGAGT